MAKKFFYACAGLFLLGLSYHAGAGSVAAQTSGQVVAGGDSWAFLSDGTVYRHAFVANGMGPWVLAGHLAAPGGVVGVSTSGFYSGGVAFVRVLMDDGAFWEFRESGESIFLNSIFGTTPTATVPQTWGQVKDRYRK